MLPKMRRFRQALTAQECETVLKRNTNGILALKGKEYPYAIPVNYVFHQGKIYFHTAKVGYKLELMQQCNQVCFTVVDQDEIVEEKYTSYYRSVQVFGTMSLVEENSAEHYESLMALVDKYCPTRPQEERTSEVEKGVVQMVAISIEEMSGKQAKELVQG